MLRNRHFWLLLALSGVLYAGTAGWPANTDDADGGHAVAARGILESGDWVVLQINGIRWIEKPPLHYWLVAISYKIFGQHQFATRLPLALSTVGLVLVTWAFGRRFFSERAGLLAGLAMATGFGAYLFTRSMIPEAMYALQFAAAFYLFLRAWEGSLHPKAGYLGCAALIGLAALTRATVGFLFPFAILTLFLLAVRGRDAQGRERWREFPFWSFLGVFLLVAAPWHILAAVRVPGFVDFYFFNETFGRALGWRYPQDFGSVPLGLWWAEHLAWLFPWSVFLLFAGRELPRPQAWRALDRAGQARLFLFLWAGFILLFFSVTRRMEYYSFAAWPALALLAGLALERLEEERSRWLPRVSAGLAVTGLLLSMTLAGLVWLARGTPPAEDISRLLELQDESHYRLAMSSFSDLTVAAFASLRRPALAAAAALFVALCVPWWLRRRGARLAASLLMALGMAGFIFAANDAFRIFEPHMSSRPLAEALRPLLRADDRLVIYGEFYGGATFAFYTRRRALLLNGRYNGLEFGSYFPDAPPIFLTDRDFPALWSGSGRVFLLAPQHWRREVLLRLPPQRTWLAAEQGGKAVYVNQPLTPDQPALARAGAVRENRR